MRLYSLFLALLCSLHLAAQMSEKNDFKKIDSLDYISMFQMSESILIETCGDRLASIVESGDRDLVLEPQNDEEFKNMLLSMFSYYVGLIRLRQEIACLRNPELADDAMESIMLWQNVLGCLPMVTAYVTIECLKQWAETEIDRSWKPEGDISLYRPVAEWPKLRRAAAEELIQVLEDAFNEATEEEL